MPELRWMSKRNYEEKRRERYRKRENKKKVKNELENGMIKSSWTQQQTQVYDFIKNCAPGTLKHAFGLLSIFLRCQRRKRVIRNQRQKKLLQFRYFVLRRKFTDKQNLDFWCQKGWLNIELEDRSQWWREEEITLWHWNWIK